MACLPQTALDLHQASGIRGHHCVRPGADDVRDLSLQDRAREVRLRDVVGTCASAAPVRLRERDDLQSRYRREERAWLLADLLTVEQVTGIVPGDPGVERSRPLAHPKVAEEFGGVLDLRREGR